MLVRWLNRCATLMLVTMILACSKPDPIVGSWKFSHGVLAKFTADGNLEIIDENGNSRGTAGWTRDGDYLNINSSQPILGSENRFLISKLRDDELVLKGTSSSDLLSSVLQK